MPAAAFQAASTSFAREPQAKACATEMANLQDWPPSKLSTGCNHIPARHVDNSNGTKIKKAA